MKNQPDTINELVKTWSRNLADPDNQNSAEIADFIISQLVDNDHFEEWYYHNQTIAEVFNLAADLDALPYHINSITANSDIPKVVERIKVLVKQLEKKYDH